METLADDAPESSLYTGGRLWDAAGVELVEDMRGSMDAVGEGRAEAGVDEGSLVA